MGILAVINKKAMTLAEVIFVFVIIGIIASLAIVTVKPWDKACKYSYSRMYHSLRLAFYNSMLTKTEFPTTSTNFCKSLVEFINTSSNGDNCAQTRDLTRNPRIFPEEKIQINASNGSRIWIGACDSAINTASLKCEAAGKPFQHIETETSGATSTTKYYLVYVDLNGEKGPNTAQWSQKKVSDIVAFAVTDTLTVIPLGHPEVDNRYLLAHVVYPQVGEDDPDGNVSEEMTYYEAKKYAWGNTVDSSDTMSLNIQNDLTDDSYFKINYNTFFPTTPAVDTANGCSAISSACYVDIHEYH